MFVYTWRVISTSCHGTVKRIPFGLLKNQDGSSRRLYPLQPRHDWYVIFVSPGLKIVGIGQVRKCHRSMYERKRMIVASWLFSLSVRPQAIPKESVKIGLITPLTGDVKTFGESSKNAFLIAIEDYAKTGKYADKPRDRGRQERPDGRSERGTQAHHPGQGARHHRAPDIEGRDSGERDRGEVPDAHDHRHCDSPKVTVSKERESHTCSAHASSTLSRGSVAATFALKDLKAKTAAILYDVGNDYSKGLAEVFRATFKKGNGTVAAYRVVPEGRCGLLRPRHQDTA